MSLNNKKFHHIFENPAATSVYMISAKFITSLKME